MSRKKNKNSVTKVNNENSVNNEGGRIMAMLNGMMMNENDANVNGGNIMNQQNNQNQVNQVAQQVMQQATVAGGGQPQVQAVPVQMTNPNPATQAYYVMPQQGGQQVPVQFVDPNQVQQLMQQQAVAQQLTNPNPATQAQQVMPTAGGQQVAQTQQVQATAQQPKVVYVPVPAAQVPQQQAAAPQVVVEAAEEESSFSDDHPWLTLGLIAAGAYVGYKFVSNVFFDDDNSSSSVSENDTIDLVPADFSSFF